MSSAGRAPAGRTLAVLGLVGGIVVVVVAGYATFRVWQRGDVDDSTGLGPADAIVVLGAAQYDGRPSPVFRARLDHAIELWQAGRAPLLIMTGGRQEGDRTTEAASGRAYAVAQGVPAAAILTEDRGRTTQESLEAVAAILRAHGARNAIFVSDRMHMLRVMRMAKDLGIDAYASPTTDSPHGRDAGGAPRRHRARARRAGLVRVRRQAASRGTDGDWPAPDHGAGRSRHPAGIRPRCPAPKTPSWPVDVRPLYSGRCCARKRRRARCPQIQAAALAYAEADHSEGVVKQVEDATFVDLIACERDCRSCSYAAALDCDGNCGVCQHNAYCPCVNPVVARSKTALRLIELRPILLQDVRGRI